MTRNVDLNQLRDRIGRNREAGQDMPGGSNAVYVDPNGNIVTQPQFGEQRQLSQVPQKTFATTLMRDRQVVAQKLPGNAQEMVVNGVTGWVYDIQTELGDFYKMFIFHDGSLYQVMVVFPEVAGRYSPVDGHLFADGRICLNDAHGYNTLEKAYAKSVLWANGFSVYVRNGNFPF